jgi:hypothetical protein
MTACKIFSRGAATKTKKEGTYTFETAIKNNPDQKVGTAFAKSY